MKDRHYNHFFPTPRYLEMSGAGIDISDRSIKLVKLDHDKGALKVSKFGEKKIPPGIIESGKIKDHDTVSRLLEDLKKEYGLRYVRASLPEEQIYLFRMGIPKMTASEIRGTIELSLEEHVPLTPQDSFFDYEILEETADTFTVLVIVAPREVVDEYTSLFEKAGLDLLSLELESSAAARAVVHEGDDNTYMIIDFGDSRTGISIVHKRLPLFTSTVSIGGATLTEMVAKDFGVSYDEAEKMKREAGLSMSEGNKEIFSVLLNGVSILRDEINRHFIYWHTHKDEEGKDRPKIQSIILCGGNANLSGVVEYLKSSLRAEIVLSNVWSNIHDLKSYVPPISFKESQSYAAAIGLALGDFEHQ